MTRIGFAYNQKPTSAAPRVADDADEPRADEEPPSSRRDNWSRTSAQTVPAGAVATLPSPAALWTPDDEFAEWDDEETIAAVERALRRLGQVVRLEANAEFPERLRAARPDIVFNMAEGLQGVNREAHVPAMCEFFGIPYTGSDPFTLALCLDKARTKEMLAYHGVPTAPFVVVRNAVELEGLVGGKRESGRGRRDAGRGPVSAESRIPTPASRLPNFPLFVKPVHEGSSKGITEKNYCRTPAEVEAQVAFLLERYEQPVLIEEYLPGAEFTCAVLGNGDRARVLPIIGMRFDALPDGALPVYGFEAKWLWDRPEHPLEIFDCPARIDDTLRARIEEVTLHAYRVLACRDWSRIDVRLDAAGVPNVVEVNPLPGILPNPEDNSCFPKAARAAGMSYDQLIRTCVRLAAERQGIALSGRAVRGVKRAAAMGARP